MKVICAGVSKTGTKSLADALETLGFKTYDTLENFHEFEKEWRKIIDGEPDIAKLQEIYKNIDAAVDMPIYPFWDLLLQAFPDAKVILTVRDNEDEFFKSMKYQTDAINKKFSMLTPLCSPTLRRFLHFVEDAGSRIFCNKRGRNILKASPGVNEELLKMCYRRHNAYVQQRTPPEQLLVFNCKEKWTPLCSFLGVPVPSKPFPHKNIKGDILETFSEKPFFLQVKREVTISIICVISFLVVILAFIIW